MSLIKITHTVILMLVMCVQVRSKEIQVLKDQGSAKEIKALQETSSSSSTTITTNNELLCAELDAVLHAWRLHSFSISLNFSMLNFA